MKLKTIYIVAVIVLSCAVLGLYGCGGGGGTGGSGGGLPDASFTIESIADYGKHPAITVDSDGNPHISYTDLDDKYVKYATKSTGSWVIDSVEYVANSSGTVSKAGLTSIALDSNNKPHISYYCLKKEPDDNVYFKYARKTGATWDITPILLPDDPLFSYSSPFIPWAESSIVVDKATNTAHIALQMLGGRSGYVLGYWNNGFTQARMIDYTGTYGDKIGYHNAIALDTNGYPFISYEDRVAGDLKLARWDGAAFIKETVATMPEVYWEDRLTSIDLDVSDNPCIAYMGSSDHDYRMAYKGTGSWSIITLPEFATNSSIAMCLDSNDNPHIALVNFDYDLRYGYWTGSAWSFSTVDTDVNNCAIAVDVSNNVHIVYTKDGEVKYARN